jgi:hypothetical protein
MAITQPALARAMARDLARAAPPEAGIKRIWVWTEHGRVDPEREYVEFSVLADPTDKEAEHALLVAISNVAELYPDVNVGASTFAPGDYAESELREWMHPEAQEIDLDVR